MTLQGHPRWLILEPIEARMALFLLVLEAHLGPILPILPRYRYVRAFVRRKPHFFAPNLYSGDKFGCSLWSRCVMLSSCEERTPVQA